MWWFFTQLSLWIIHLTNNISWELSFFPIIQLNPFLFDLIMLLFSAPRCVCFMWSWISIFCFQFSPKNTQNKIKTWPQLLYLLKLKIYASTIISQTSTFHTQVCGAWVVIQIISVKFFCGGEFLWYHSMSLKGSNGLQFYLHSSRHLSSSFYRACQWESVQLTKNIESK